MDVGQVRTQHLAFPGPGRRAVPQERERDQVPGQAARLPEGREPCAHRSRHDEGAGQEPRGVVLLRALLRADERYDGSRHGLHKGPDARPAVQGGHLGLAPRVLGAGVQRGREGVAGREYGLGDRVVPSREPDLPGRADGFRIPRDTVREREPTGLVCEVLQAGCASRERSQVRQTKARRPLQRGAGVPRRAATRARNKTLTVKQVATRCAAVTDDTIKAFRTTLAAPRYRLAARAYEAGLAKNPNLREALYNLGGIYYLLDDTTKALPVAQRLYAVDPLNRTSLAKLAGAWQLRGKKDSTLHYLTIADSLSLEVSVGTFAPGDSAVTLNGLITNTKAKPSAPAAVTFEFLNGKGEVVATDTTKVPAIDASGNHAFEIKKAGAGIVAWRYRRS